jgi:hypothetical protein
VLDASQRPDLPSGIGVHFISFGWSPLFAIVTLPQVLRNIRIQLIDVLGSGAPAGGHATSMMTT